MTSAAPASSVPPPADPPKLLKASRMTTAFMVLVALAGISLVLWAWRLGPFATAEVSTENAFVRGQMTLLAPQVSGYVAEVVVGDFQYVRAGDILVRIDDRTYAEKVRQAHAQIASADAQLANATQTLAQNRASLAASKASLASAEAEASRAEIDLRRSQDLVAQGFVSTRDRDQAMATAKLARANVLKARAEITISEETIKSTEVARGGLEAQVKMAQAQLGLAEIDLANTVIRAPRDGQVGEATVRQGQFVSAGSQLMFLVPEKIWVVANLKETQMADVHVGQPARFRVDALNHAEFTGRVEQIAPATGSEFSVLRADNATGNFTKIVQRLPVRIAIDPGQALAERLRPGMSVVARVDTGARGSATDGAAAP
ncbi:HlyD family secretion protein [Variovorax sp. J2P1-59]|nr:HlyD family secretion protein [Variovorax sp. J2P1-59]MDM0078637.1 HlyD family secretion protein [Variovorax sp. J2P1-59]